MKPLIAVAGKGRNCPTWLEDQAYTVGEQLAVAHASRLGLVTGGLGGVMNAASQGFRAGARQSGERTAHIVALLPSPREEGAATEAATLMVETGQPSQVRNWILANTCDAMVVLYGSHGTWQETAFALDLGKRVWGLDITYGGAPRGGIYPGEPHQVRFPGVTYLGSVEQLVGAVGEWLNG